MPMPSNQISSLSTVKPIADILLDFELMTENAGQVQKDILQDILKKNAHTEYLQQFGVEEETDEDTFRTLVPLITHADIKHQIHRIVNGDRTPILTADPVHKVFLSSGTTNGEQKYIPLYSKILQNSFYLAKLGATFRSMVYPMSPGGRILEFRFCGRVFKTAGGLEAATATTHLFRSNEYKQARKATRVNSCSPEAVTFASNCDQAMYCHLLCGLLYRTEVQQIFASFAYTLVEAFRVLEREWESLCDDISRGHLNERIDDPLLRSSVTPLLQQNSNPESAAQLSVIFQEGMDTLIPRLWPNCKYIHSIMTGSMKPYQANLKQYAGDLPLVSADYGATENWIGVNANPKAAASDATFTVVPSFGYFEFIPLLRCETQTAMTLLNNDSDSATAYLELEPVNLTEVKVGKEYEIVLTTYGGLYRYRLGDMVRVTGFYNSSPQLTFVCRKNVLLSVHIDKTTENDVQIVVSKAASEMRAKYEKLELVDFTSYADLSSKPGHYIIFWEVKDTAGFGDSEMNNNKLGLFRDLATLMDSSFVEAGYVGCRKVKTIGPLELRLVKAGTFRFLLEQYLARGTTAITQYKIPRCVNSKESLRILISSTIHTFTSAD